MDDFFFAVLFFLNYLRLVYYANRNDVNIFTTFCHLGLIMPGGEQGQNLGIVAG
jgi:hypothetical protein